VEYTPKEIKMLRLSYPGNHFRDLHDALDEIERLQKLHEWIPVTERLPEYGYRVFVISEGETEIGWVNNINGVKTFNLPSVTKWQPLPPQEQP
jgi:squalene cyclase